MSNATPAGWYPDGQGNERWWDGTQWTDNTRPLGGGGAPAPAAPAAPAGDQPGGHDAATRVGTPGGDRPQGGGAPAAPAGGAATPPPADATMVAPARGGTPGQPAQPGYGAPGGQPPATPQPGYGAPGGQPPGTPAYGTPQPGYGAPGAPGGQVPPQAGPPQPGYGAGGQGIPPGYHQPTPSWAPGGSGGGKGGKMVALIGGGLALLMVLVVLALIFVIGGSSPTSATEDYFNAIKDGDCDAFFDVASDDLQELAGDKDDCEDDPDEFLEGNELDGCELEVTGEKIDGDKATVEFDVTDCDDGEQNDEGGELNLVEQDGDWKIDVTKLS